jgi:hypothetical protein
MLEAVAQGAGAGRWVEWFSWLALHMPFSIHRYTYIGGFFLARSCS